MLLWLLACSGAADPAPSADALSGTWTFGEECGTTSGGSPVTVNYTLLVNGTQASLSADGYQTMLRVQGSLQAKDDGRIELVVDSAGKEGAFSDLYKAGDLLLTFRLVDDVLEGTPNKLSIHCSPSLKFERLEG